MFCPNCNAYLKENHLIKKNVKKFENADIEYDARCPACNEEIGHMFWGAFTPAKQFLGQELRQPQPPEPSEAAATAQAEAPSAADEDGIRLSWPQPVQPERCSCPYCGKLLPKEYQKNGPSQPL